MINNPTDVLTVREAALEDSDRIAQLSGQLGYLAASPEIRQRLAAVQPRESDLILVAQLPGEGVVGWAHACLVQHLMTPAYVELAGLVVDEHQRSAGIGAALLSEVERWGRKKGCKEIWVRCNIIRERAHRFYLRSGYQLKKSQHVFVKCLGG